LRQTANHRTIHVNRIVVILAGTSFTLAFQIQLLVETYFDFITSSAFYQIVFKMIAMKTGHHLEFSNSTTHTSQKLDNTRINNTKSSAAGNHHDQIMSNLRLIN